ncbi:MAG TPA: hypothetical protein VL981_06590 [Candidatus Methylacidiphilales bacterium]|nr:hypothetical protein [Candidatus Methylacidiphilales bacterium]
MLKAISSLWQNLQGPKLFVDVALDHIELADEYLMLGIELDWHNQTSEDIKVREVKVRFFQKSRLEEPVKFYTQGHFERIEGQRRQIRKTVGLKSFVLPAKQYHLEGIRLFTRSIFDIEDGMYPVDIHTIVAGGTYVHQADIQVTSAIKYRTSEPWIATENLP